MALLILLGLQFLAALTGYLGPSHTQARGEETLNRFIGLHVVALPVLIGCLLLECYWFFGPFLRSRPWLTRERSSSDRGGLEVAKVEAGGDRNS